MDEIMRLALIQGGVNITPQMVEGRDDQSNLDELTSKIVKFENSNFTKTEAEVFVKEELEPMLVGPQRLAVGIACCNIMLWVTEDRPIDYENIYRAIAVCNVTKGE